MNSATKVGSPIKCGQSSNEVIICIINSFEPKTQTAEMLRFFSFLSDLYDASGRGFPWCCHLNSTGLEHSFCSSNIVSDEQLIRGKLFFKGKGWK